MDPEKRIKDTRVGAMPSDSNDQMNILLSFDINGTLQRVTQPPGGKPEDALSMCPPGKLSQTGKKETTAQQDLLQTPAEAQQQLLLMFQLTMPSQDNSNFPNFRT